MIKKVLPEDGLVLFFVLLYSIFNIAALFLMKDNLSILLSFPLFLLRFYSFKDTKLPKELTKFVYWNYLELSFISLFFIRAFNGSPVHDLASISTFQTGLVILVSNFILICLLNRFLIQRKLVASSPPDESKAMTLSFTLLILSTFIVSFIGYKLDIGRMGITSPYYPYKLESIINHYKNTISLFIFILISDYFWEKKKIKRSLIVLALLILFTILESIIKASRGSFFLMVILLSSWAIYREIISFKKVVTILAPIFVTILLLFPVITELRASRIDGKSFSISRTIKNYSLRSLVSTSLYARVFGAGEEIRKFKEKLPTDFKGANLMQLFKMKGAPVYHTRVVDQIPEDIAHSSGITGLGDGYIFGGSLFLIFTSLFYTFLFSSLDNNVFSLFAHPLTKTLSAYWLYLSLFAGNGLWSTLARSPFYIAIWPLIFFISWFWLFKAKALRTKAL
jgi:hypothetical protein